MSPVPPQTFLMATSTPLWKLRWHSVSPGERWLSKTSNRATRVWLLPALARFEAPSLKARAAQTHANRLVSLEPAASRTGRVPAMVDDDNPTGDKRRFLGRCRFGHHAKR